MAIYAVKRLIGKKFNDPEIQRIKEVLPYEIAEADNGDVTIR